jgi:hypothetical protein
VPPGISVTQGVLYDIQDTINLTHFAGQLVTFRQWLAAKGERDKPLIVSEYAALPADFYGPGEAVNYVLTGTFAYMRDARSQTIGYPGDDNRLVQRWVYYSLDDTVNSTSIMQSNGALDALGTAWIDYVANPAHGFNPRTAAPHFRALRTDPAVPYSPDGNPIHVTLYPQVDNSGNVSTTVTFTAQLTDQQQPLSGVSQFAPLDGCGARATGSAVTFYNMQPGVHTVTVQVNWTPADPPSQVRLLIATRRIFLPYLVLGTHP